MQNILVDLEQLNVPRIEKAIIVMGVRLQVQFQITRLRNHQGKFLKTISLVTSLDLVIIQRDAWLRMDPPLISKRKRKNT